MRTTRAVAFTFFLAVCSFLQASDKSTHLPRVRPDESLRPKIVASFRVNYVIRSEGDNALVQTMIQVDRPPTNMAFDMSLRSGGQTWRLGPVAWAANDIHWWAYDTDLPANITTVDVVLTPSAMAAVKIKQQTRHYPPNLADVWGGTEIVFPAIKIKRQRITMCKIVAPNQRAAIEEASERLVSAEPLVRQLKLDHNLPQAITSLQQTVKDAPGEVRPRFNLGCLQIANGDYSAALESFADARQLEPTLQEQRDIQSRLRRICAICLDGAEKGKLPEMCALGRAYESGWGVGQDYQQAKRWFRNASNAGHVESMRRLASIYENKLGAKVQTENAQQWYRVQARDWYQKAADLGDEKAKQWISTHDLR